MKCNYVERVCESSSSSRTEYSHLVKEVQLDINEMIDCGRWVCDVGIQFGVYLQICRLVMMGCWVGSVMGGFGINPFGSDAL